MDMVRYKLRYKLCLAQITQWDFQNKGTSGWTGKSSFVLKVPLRYLRPSIMYSVPCDRIVPIKPFALMKVWLLKVISNHVVNV